MPKICKDGRIWGQNNKEAGDHLGILARGNLTGKYEKKLTDEENKNRWQFYGIKTRFQKGKNHPCWRGGITHLHDAFRNTKKFKQWRSDIFVRDGWTCQTCKKRENQQVHHLTPLLDILRKNNITTIEEMLKCKELWDINNGITLCKECHKLAERNRKQCLTVET